jgi:hypothetical protein
MFSRGWTIQVPDEKAIGKIEHELMLFLVEVGHELTGQSDLLLLL